VIVAVLDSYADIVASPCGPDGVFFCDTRDLSRLELPLNGEQPLLLGSNVREDNSILTVDLTPTYFSITNWSCRRMSCTSCSLSSRGVAPPISAYACIIMGRAPLRHRRIAFRCDRPTRHVVPAATRLTRTPSKRLSALTHKGAKGGLAAP
jgi:hypothetical protein